MAARPRCGCRARDRSRSSCTPCRARRTPASTTSPSAATTSPPPTTSSRTPALGSTASRTSSPRPAARSSTSATRTAGASSSSTRSGPRQPRAASLGRPPRPAAAVGAALYDRLAAPPGGVDGRGAKKEARTVTQSATLTSVYERIGVKPVINARGFMIVLGGSTPSPRVKQAMEEAERYYVEMKDLLQKGGEIIAEKIGCEAACITGDDLDKIARLPDTTGMKNEVVMQACQRYSYQRATTIVGTRLVEVGDENGATPEQLAAAIGPRTACVLYVAHLESRPGALSFDQVLEIAHRKGVPVLTDAAGQVYPLDRMRSYTKRGADLVAFGAKYIGSVHSSGILCGKKALVDAAVPQGFIGFETVAERKSFGRPLKLDRQEIVGVITAVEEWFSMDHEKRVAELERRLDALRRAL